MRALPARITALLLLLALGLSVYRAKFQSFTVDEAHVYRMFVSKDLAEMAKVYDACNHVLHTLLMKLCRYWFGTGELALRIPSLLGAALFLRALFVMTARYFSGWWQPLVALALVSYPMLLDHMVAARGYGLALAFLLWSLVASADWTTRGFRERDLLRAGIFAGLAIATNLVYLLPTAALGSVLLLIGLKFRRGWSVVERYGVSSIALSFLFVVLPLLKYQPGSFYWGALSWNETVASLYDGMLKANRAWTFGFLAINKARFELLGIVLFFLFAGAFVVICLMFWRKANPHFEMMLPLVIFGTLMLTVAAHQFLQGAAGMRLPLGRTGLHLVMLLLLGIATAARFVPLRGVRISGAIALLLISLMFVSQTEARFFQEWRYDAFTPDLLRRMDEDRRARGLTRVTVAASRPFYATISYYRERRKLFFMPESPRIDNIEKSEADYFVLVEDETGLIDKLGLEKLYENGTTKTVLARRPG